MSESVPTPIPVNGALNTTDPVSAVPTGTLVEAVDCAHRYIGPRRGRSRAVSALTADSVTRTVYELDGTNDYWLHRYHPDQMVLGLYWTLDVVYEPTAVGSGSGTLVSLGNTTHSDIHLRLLGTGSGANERKTRAVVQASNAAGAVGVSATCTDAVQLTLSSAGSPLQDYTKVYHTRLIRHAAALTMVVNGNETTATGLSSTTGHSYVHDGLYVGGHSTLATNYLGGWIYKVMLRAGVFTDLSDVWLDPFHTRTPSVLLCTTGGPPSIWAGSASGFAQELSRFRNYGSVVGSPATDSIGLFPFMAAAQGYGSYVDRYGAVRNILVCNGVAFHEQVS